MVSCKKAKIRPAPASAKDQLITESSCGRRTRESASAEADHIGQQSTPNTHRPPAKHGGRGSFTATAVCADPPEGLRGGEVVELAGFAIYVEEE